MIRVLLVDDEKLALEYLENIISWELYGFEIVGALTDAGQALKLFRKTHPELVISDVRMYGMDGIDFSAAVKEIDPGTHILFLSGYRNFEYVQEAIALGIDDYMLKSDLTEEQFLSKVLRIKEKIEKEKQKKEYTESAVFKELFAGRHEERYYRDLLGEKEYVRLHKKYCYLIVSRRKAPSFVEQFIPDVNEENYVDETAIVNALRTESFRSGISPAAVFPLNTTEELCVLDLTVSTVSENEIYEKVYSLACAVFEKINDEKCTAYNVVFYPKGCSVRQFRQFWEKRRKEDNRFYTKRKAQIAEFGTAPDISSDFPGENLTAVKIEKDLEDGNRDQCERLLEALMIAVEQDDVIGYLWYTKEIFIALHELEDFCRKERRPFALAESCGTYDLTSPEGMIRFVRFKFDEVLTLFDRDTKREISRSIEAAIAYIEEHYSDENLSSNSIAKSAGISASWLSTRFKEEVGSGVSDYISRVRVEHAKELLNDDKYMIYEVADRTGFASSQYFSRIFKQLTGLTPNEYRRNRG